jgi:hypothetical protein
VPAAGSKGAPKNPGELKDDTSSSREEKQVKKFPVCMISLRMTSLSVRTHGLLFFTETLRFLFFLDIVSSNRKTYQKNIIKP